MMDNSKSNEPLSSRQLHQPRILPPVFEKDLIGRDIVVNRLRRSQPGIITAPAGYGKTFVLTAVRQCFIEDGLPVSWLSLRVGDVDLEEFLCSLISSLRNTLGARFGTRTEALFKAGVGTPIHILVDTLVAEIADDGIEAVLIIDDVHLLEQPDALDLLAGLVRRAPIRLVIAGRYLSKVLAAAVDWLQVLEVGAEHLCLNVLQAKQYYEILSDSKLTDDQAEHLHVQTQGWQAGIKLLASSGKHITSSNDPIPVPVPGRVYTYLDRASEGLNEEARGFMLELSILEYFSVELSAAVFNCDEQSARDTLSYLVQQGVFIETIEQEQGWSRFHPMFREYLQERLKKENPDNISKLHKSAARWFMSKERWNDALIHTVQAGDQEMVANLIGTSSRKLILDGDFSLFFSWVQQLPETVRQLNWQIRIAEAWVFTLTFQSVEAIRILNELDSQIFIQNLPIESLREIKVMRIVIDLVADKRSDAFKLIDEISTQGPAKDHWIQEVTNNFCAYKYLCTGSFERVRTQPECHSSLRIIYQQVFQALSWFEQGHFQCANDCFEAVFQYCESRPHGVKGAAYVFGYHAEVLAMRGEFDLIRERFDKYGTLVLEIVPALAVVNAISSNAFAYAQRGDFTSAQQCLEQGTTLARLRGWDRLDVHCCTERAKIWLLQGEYAPARRLLQRLQEKLSHVSDPLLQKDLEHMILITELRIGLKTGLEKDSLKQATDYMHSMEETGFKLRSFKWRALLAAAHKTNGHAAIGRRLIEPLRRWQEVEGASAFEQYMGCYSKQIAPLTKLNVNPVDEQIFLNVEPINTREHEILILVAQGLTNKEIAQSLCIGAETVKWHLKNVFGKLQVKNRTQAVARARRLELIL